MRDDEPAGGACALWLLPESQQAAALAGNIGRLARRFGTPRFEPHATLLGAMPCGRGEDLTGCAASLAAGCGPLELPVTGIGGGEAPFRILYLRLGESPALGDLRAAAARRCPHREAQPWFPHLSLLYGRLPATVLRRLAAELAGSFPASLRFDRIALIDARGPVSTWRRITEKALAGGAPRPHGP